MGIAASVIASVVNGFVIWLVHLALLMKILVEFDITPSTRDNPDAKLDAQQVTRRLARRLQNADVTKLQLPYEVGGQRVWFSATAARYTAIE